LPPLAKACSQVLAGNEELSVAEWIVSRIETDTTLEAYFGSIPASKVLPAVRFHVQARSDQRGLGTPASRIMTTIDWLIVVVREGLGVAGLVQPATDLDGALHGKSGSTASVQVLKCIRVEPFTLLEVLDSGVQYRHAGGLYRTICQGV